MNHGVRGSYHTQQFDIKDKAKQIQITASYNTDFQYGLDVAGENIARLMQYGYNHYVKIQGNHGCSLFFVGFLLLEEYLFSHWSINPKAKKATESCLLTAASSIKFETSEKIVFRSLSQKLNNFLELVPKFKQKSDVAKYLCQKIQEERDFSQLILQLGRCVVFYQQEHQGLASKLTSKTWYEDSLYQMDYFRSFTKVANPTLEFIKILKKGLSQISSNSCEICFSFDNAQSGQTLVYFIKEEIPQEMAYSSPSKDILTRSQRPVNQEIPKQSVQMTCQVCHQGYDLSQLIRNEKCDHYVCFDCIQDKQLYKHGFCWVSRCPKALSDNTRRLMMSIYNDPSTNNQVPEEGFINQQPQNSVHQSFSAKPFGLLNQSGQFSSLKSGRGWSSTQSIPISCDLCAREVDKENPAFTNICGHSYCSVWLRSKRPNYNGHCFVRLCRERLNYYAFGDFLAENGISGIQTECNSCRAVLDKSKSFMNPSCQHSFCSKCSQRLKNMLCPVERCDGHIDQRSYTDYQMGLFKEDDDNLIKYLAECPSCKKQTELCTQKKNKIEYWKCQSCSSLVCFKHMNLMKECLCLCPRCIGELAETSDSKNCQRCSVSYCLRCKTEKSGRSCNCRIETEEDVRRSTKRESFINSQSQSQSQPRQLTEQEKIREISCSNCNDFREFPQYLKLDCGHRLCEYCILQKKDFFAKSRSISCLVCR